MGKLELSGELKIDENEVEDIVRKEALRRLANSGLKGVTLNRVKAQKTMKHFEHPYDHRQDSDAEVDDGFLVEFTHTQKPATWNEFLRRGGTAIKQLEQERDITQSVLEKFRVEAIDVLLRARDRMAARRDDKTFSLSGRAEAAIEAMAYERAAYLVRNA